MEDLFKLFGVPNVGRAKVEDFGEMEFVSFRSKFSNRVTGSDNGS